MQETSQTGSNSGSSSPVCNGGGASPVTPSPAVSPNSNSMGMLTEHLEHEILKIKY